MKTKMKTPALALVLAIGGFGVTGSAQAGLIDRGGGLLYDDVLNVTWLQDANYAETMSYTTPEGRNVGENGMMNWSEAKTWASTLVYHDTVRNLDYSGWRLPTMIDTEYGGCDWTNSGSDCGYNVQTVSAGTVYSEMAHMYYNNLGLKGKYSPSGEVQSDWGIFGNGTWGGSADVGLVHNLHTGLYWFGLYYPYIVPSQYGDHAWDFAMRDGMQFVYNVDSANLFAWAVRPGDVAAPIPEPGTLTLILASLGLLGLTVRRLKRNAR